MSKDTKLVFDLMCFSLLLYYRKCSLFLVVLNICLCCGLLFLLSSAKQDPNQQLIKKKKICFS